MRTACSCWPPPFTCRTIRPLPLSILAAHAEIVHGWDDEVILCEHAIRFAQLRGCALHLVPDGHRLDASIPLLSELFGAFLSRCGGTGDRALKTPAATY